MLRIAQFTLILASLAGFASSSPLGDGIAEARQCAAAANYECAFERLIALAESEDLPLADETAGVELLAGAMLESSLIRASDNWSPETAKAAAERYLAFISNKHPNVNIFYATGHSVRAMSCGQLGDSFCRAESVSFLCENRKRLVAPMRGHPSHQEFGNRTINLLFEECGEVE